MTKVYCMICKKNPVVLAIIQAFPDTPVCKSCLKEASKPFNRELIKLLAENNYK